MTRQSSRLQAKQKAISQVNSAALTSDAEKDSDPEELQVSASTVRRKRAHDESSGSENDIHQEERTKARRKRTARKKAKIATDNKEQGAIAKSAKHSQKVPADKRFRWIRGKLGLLDKVVTDMPIEIIFEIFRCLSPLDILHLARTSKVLRNILMNRSSESIWRAARANVPGLPPLPPNLSEPQYANLMFDPTCNICLKKGRCENVIWGFYIRCCRTCEFKRFSTTQDIFVEYTSLGKDAAMLLLDVMNVLPSYSSRARARDTYVELYQLSDVKPLIAEFEAIEHDGEKRLQWFEERERVKKEVDAHVQLCKNWHKMYLDDRAREVEGVRAQRRQDIIDKLDELGWADEVRIMMNDPDDREKFTLDSSVNQPIKLSDSIWARIKPYLVNFLEEHKASRLEKERWSALHSRYSLLEKMYNNFCEQGTRLQTAIPSLGDIFASTLFDRIIWATPFDQEVTENDYSGIFAERLPAFFEEWRTAREDELVDILKQSAPNAIGNKSDLYLATSIFECADPNDPQCQEQLWYPRVACHHPVHDRWPRPAGPGTERRTEYVDTGIFDPFAQFRCGIWKPQRVRFSSRGSEKIRTVVEACGLKPATATFDDLFALDPLIKCDQCSGADYQTFFRWPGALVHIDHKLDVNVLGEFQDEILKASKKDYIPGGKRCRICNSLKWGNSIEEHLRNTHNITDLDISTQRDWYWDMKTLIKEGIARKFVFRFPK